MPPASNDQITAIVSLLGRTEARRRGIDLDRLDPWNADMLILGLLGEYWQTTIVNAIAQLGDAITAAANAYVASLRAALNEGADQ